MNVSKKSSLLCNKLHLIKEYIMKLGFKVRYANTQILINLILEEWVCLPRSLAWASLSYVGSQVHRI